MFAEKHPFFRSLFSDAERRVLSMATSGAGESILFRGSI
jgi:hypothetical protein